MGESDRRALCASPPRAQASRGGSGSVQRLGVALPALALSLIAPLPAHAQVDCERLGSALTEHSCFHAEYGPWETVRATPGRQLESGTANVDAVHTQWLVELPEGPGVVSYRPQRDGQWVVFTEPPGLASVLNEEGDSIEQSYESQETGCRFLGRVQAFELQLGRRYTLVLDPKLAGARAMVAVIEKIDDFSTVSGPDRDGDGYGSPEGALVTPCEPPEGYVTNDADCDDTDARISPNQDDSCDGIDNDCDGTIDNPRGACGEGLGRCAARGDWVCERQTRVCVQQAAQQRPLGPIDEICNGVDDDCDGAVDNPEAELCDSGGQAPQCVRLATETRCGCTQDSQCGSPDSGRICDLTTNLCRPGCFAYDGRNGCPRGEVCETVAPAAAGLCVDDCDEGLCEGSLAGAADAGLSASDDLGDTSGCSCRLSRPRGQALGGGSGGAGGEGRGPWLLVAALGGLLGRRRAWRRVPQ